MLKSWLIHLGDIHRFQHGSFMHLRGPLTQSRLSKTGIGLNDVMVWLLQVRQLERDAANHQVKATVEKGRKLNRIRLQGDAKDITDVIFNVVKILKEVEVAELKRNEAERIAQQVRLKTIRLHKN